MIIGSGMMAKAFSDYADDANVLIFASGVSNSLETNEEAFLRERSLLLRAREENPDKLLVYFGTCSVYDPERQNTPYVLHKLEMERLLAASESPWMVLRLPLAIGVSHQGSTLAQFLYRRIRNAEPFEVWARATRYPVDVEDVLWIAGRFIVDRELWNRKINIALKAFPVLRFVKVMEEILGKAAVYRLVEKGQSYEIPCPELASVAIELRLNNGDDYLAQVLWKYFGSTTNATTGS